MQILKKISKFLLHPSNLLLSLDRRGIFHLPDKLFLKMKFRQCMGYKLNLKNPQTFNEKLQWLKLYDYKPEYTTMVDKYAVKKYVADKIGKQYIIPTLGVWDKPENIDFDTLPNQFVLKCTHDSGSLVICKDKSKLDIDRAKEKLKKSLKKNFYWVGREWPYKNVPKRILAEGYMVDRTGMSLRDYKVLCFHGIPKLIELHSDRFTDHYKQDFYDIEWNKLDISQEGEDTISNCVIDKPQCLAAMLKLSSTLAKNISHVRCDWYIINEKLYFSEITFYDGAGFIAFDNFKDDLLLGSWINLKK